MAYHYQCIVNEAVMVPERAGRDRADAGHAGGGGGDVPAAPGQHGRRAHLRQRAQLRRARGREEHVQRGHPAPVSPTGQSYHTPSDIKSAVLFLITKQKCQLMPLNLKINNENRTTYF